MKSNFTTIEIGSLALKLATNSNLSLRINKCGNPDISHKNADEVHFVFYKMPDGYIIRRRLGTYSGIRQHGGIMNGGKRFDTMKEAVGYFAEYMEKHKENLYKSYRRS